MIVDLVNMDVIDVISVLVSSYISEYIYFFFRYVQNQDIMFRTKERFIRLKNKHYS